MIQNILYEKLLKSIPKLYFKNYIRFQFFNLYVYICTILYIL